MTSLHGFNLKKSVITVSLALSLGIVGLPSVSTDNGFIAKAYAAESKGQGKKGGKATGGSTGAHGGKKGVYKRGAADQSIDAILSAEESSEDSDRPAWAGKNATAPKPGGGSKGSDTRKGDLFGDLYIILRDDNGVPILVKWVDGQQVIYPGSGSTEGWYVQPLDASGNPIPLDAEGHPVDESKVVEVELGRLNIARAPEKVLDHSLVEALAKLSSATVVTLDPAGRLVVDGVAIDSPLENLALFKAIVSTPAVDGIITLTATATVDGKTVTYSFPISLEQAGLVAAAAIAAASDKTGTLTTDEVMYIAKFFGLDTQLSTFVSTWNYERDDVYTDDLKVWILEGVDTNGDGVFDVYYPKEVVIRDVVEFNTVTPIVDDGNGIDSFAQAADDSVQVIEYVHDNALDQ
ncbi:MAG: hypothetical protein GC149_06475 [Gammaproteobacteria bacterium]|nr:hypothetical protein [Gammaproteobacteria bacterium]